MHHLSCNVGELGAAGPLFRHQAIRLGKYLLHPCSRNRKPFRALLGMPHLALTHSNSCLSRWYYHVGHVPASWDGWHGLGWRLTPNQKGRVTLAGLPDIANANDKGTCANMNKELQCRLRTTPKMMSPAHYHHTYKLYNAVDCMAAWHEQLSCHTMGLPNFIHRLPSGRLH